MELEAVIQVVFDTVLDATTAFGEMAFISNHDNPAVKVVNEGLKATFDCAYKELLNQGFHHTVIMDILRQTGERAQCEYQLMHMDKGDMVDAAFVIMGVRYKR